MRILIVDDDADIVEAIRTLVSWEKLGIDEVQTAGSAGTARQILAQCPADIILSDIEMPGESGLELLRWYREQGLPGRFLLLTSHQSFSYATEALKLRAEEYLLKPFRVDTLEMVLQKLVLDIREEREKLASAQDRQRRNARRRRLSLLRALLSGEQKMPGLEEAEESDELLSRADASYRVAVSRMTNLEKDLDIYGRATLQSLLENLHSEIWTGDPVNDRVVIFDQGSFFLAVTICQDEPREILLEKARELLRRCGNLLSLTVTCVLSEKVCPREFQEVFQVHRQLLERDVIHYGRAFFQEEALMVPEDARRTLDLKIMEGFLLERNKKGFLDYVKKELHAASILHTLDHDQLLSLCREIRQAIYAHLANRRIRITLLAGEESYNHLANKADQSVLDLLRWLNYLLDQVFSYEEELARTGSIVAQIDRFIEEHYQEDIGRNEVGEHFNLVPEYVAKLYKKKTGRNLKDAINDYRLQQAKRLLRDTDRKVSDIAASVGFDNFSYFSTLFKKATGMTPNAFRRGEDETAPAT